MQFSIDMITELVITLIGIFIGTLLAMAVEHYNSRRRKRQRAKVILRSLTQELNSNDKTLVSVYPAYRDTLWGKSFYVSTVAWETALASGDLPDIIGFELADTVSAQYARLSQIRYYVNLMTQLWFAPVSIDGYERIRDGFREAILNTMAQAINRHPDVMEEIQKAQKEAIED